MPSGDLDLGRANLDKVRLGRLGLDGGADLLDLAGRDPSSEEEDLWCHAIGHCALRVGAKATGRRDSKVTTENRRELGQGRFEVEAGVDHFAMSVSSTTDPENVPCFLTIVLREELLSHTLGDGSLAAVRCDGSSHIDDCYSCL